MVAGRAGVWKGLRRGSASVSPCAPCRAHAPTGCPPPRSAQHPSRQSPRRPLPKAGGLGGGPAGAPAPLPAAAIARRRTAPRRASFCTARYRTAVTAGKSGGCSRRLNKATQLNNSDKDKDNNDSCTVQPHLVRRSSPSLFLHSAKSSDRSVLRGVAFCAFVLPLLFFF